MADNTPHSSHEPASHELWLPGLRDLALELRHSVRAAMASALELGTTLGLARAVGQGSGDVTFGLDRVAEDAVDRWFELRAREAPLSLLTEDAGWRHRGPGAHGGSVALEGFDHGGPRIALDPIDGTRNLMTDLRSAWSVISFAPPGVGQPRQAEISLGLVSEIPDSRAAQARELRAERGCGAHFELRSLGGGRTPQAGNLLQAGALRVDDDDRCDHGYFPFFAFEPRQRPALARAAAEFFGRLAQDEGADVRTCWDDQYIASAGQLALLSFGTYRMVADLRQELARRDGVAATTSKPYDLAGAVLVAQEAGCVVHAVDGGPLDFPIDTETPVGFVAFANAATEARLAPHFAQALKRLAH